LNDRKVLTALIFSRYASAKLAANPVNSAV
jgi:hypothetical protein